MSTDFTFPNFKTKYQQGKYCSLQYLKYFLRRKIFSSVVNHFETRVNSAQHRINFFKPDPAIAYPVLHSFANLSFSAQQRSDAMIFDIDTVQNIFGKLSFEKLCAMKEISLVTLLEGELIIAFGRNTNSAHEGFWRIGLFNVAGEMIYAATLVFLPQKRLLIASFQGGKHKLEEMKTLTKKLDALRPQALLIVVLKIFAEKIDHQLLGIAQSHQVKCRFALKKRLKIDYDALWAESGGVNTQTGYWQLPYWQERDLMAIPTRKRAQYRRRYARFQEIQEQIKISLTVSHDPPKPMMGK